MTGKRIGAGVGVVFVVALAVIIGQRMSTDAMAVVIGVIFGVVASIPTSLLVVLVTRRAQERELETARRNVDRVPPVVVVNPGGSQGAPWASPYPMPVVPPVMEGQSTRSFRVVGDEDLVLDAQWRAKS